MTDIVLFGSIIIGVVVGTGLVLAFYLTKTCDRYHEEEHEYEADNYKHIDETKDI